MTKKVQLAVALLMVQLLAGCGRASSLIPSAPSPAASSTASPSTAAPSAPVTLPAPSPFVPNITLSGVVTEIVQGAPVPIEGVSVYCEPCGEGTHTYAYTDSKGFYTFTGVWGTSFSIWVHKDGYQDPPGTKNSSFPIGAGWRDVTINGDTRFDVQLVRK